MKKTTFFFLLILISSLAFSQDVITRTSGEIINCKITGADSTNIYFTIVRNGQKINTLLSRTSVSDIHYGENQNIDSVTADNGKDLVSSLTVGVLEGGGSLIGADLELMMSARCGLQFGAGFVGFGGGLNYHFKPTIRSSFVSVQYWHQGIDESYTQSLIGPCVVLRAKKLFTAQIGLGYALGKGPAWPEEKKQSPVMLTYAIGLYFPW